MGPRKGLSFDEKRDRLMDLFTETADFFTLKELEKIAYKRKGIVSQSVKEVLQSLVDDNLVNTDKCGVQTVFWSLPSEASQKRKTKLSNIKEELAAALVKGTRLQEELQQEKLGREKTEERTALLEAIAEKEDRLKKVTDELARFAEFDPLEMTKLEDNIKKTRQCANRWVDNIFNCQSWASKKFGMERKDFDRQFGIPSELDYVEA